MFSDAYMHAYLLGICLGEELLSHGLCSALADIGKQFSKGMPPIYKQVCCSIVSSTLGILSFYILAFYDCVLNLLFLVTKDVELFKINLLAILIFFVKCLFCPPTLFFFLLAFIFLFTIYIRLPSHSTNIYCMLLWWLRW